MSGRLPLCGPLLWDRHYEGNNMTEEPITICDAELNRIMMKNTLDGMNAIWKAMGLEPRGGTEPIGGSSS